MVVQDKSLVVSPLASVLIVTYNQESTIGQAIESALQQKCSYPFEIIVGEDCSKDSTRSVCIEYQKKYPEKIKLVLQEKNQGLLKNYYDIILESRGKYITTLGGDDYWQRTDKLQMQIDFLEKNPDYGIVHTEYDELDSQTGEFTYNIHQLKGRKIPQGNVMKQLFDNYHMAALTICFRKDIFMQHVPFPEFIKLNFKMEDIPMFVTMAKYCKVGYIDISTSTYRRNHSSVSNPTEIAKGEEYFNQLEAMNRYLCKTFPDDLKYDERIQRIYKYSSLLRLAYNCMDYKHAKEYGAFLEKDGIKSKRVLFSKNLLLFNTFLLFKKFSKN